MDILLGITETWLTQKIPNSVLLPTAAFDIVRRDHPSHVALRGGGVAFLLRPGLTYVNFEFFRPGKPVREAQELLNHVQRTSIVAGVRGEKFTQIY